MKWSPEQIDKLKTLCSDGEKNAAIAAYFGVSVTEIHAKRSQLGITIPKVEATKSYTTTADLPPKPKYEGLEIFTNAGNTCLVLARVGNTALIVMPAKSSSRFVVPLEHKPGATDWWQGKYFDWLGDAYTYYIEQIKEEEK